MCITLILGKLAIYGWALVTDLSSNKSKHIMPINFKWLLKLPTGRISRQIALWVFVSVIVIETIIFIPSFQNRRKELLNHIREISAAKITMMMKLAQHITTNDELMDHLKQLEMDPHILGGAIYQPDGKMIGRFGEHPDLTIERVLEAGEKDFVSKDGKRYDSTWMAEILQHNCTLIIRQDATSLRKELFAYFLRIGTLVIIISLFVTLGALIALEPIVITPILKLRGDLINAGDAVRNDRNAPEFETESVKRRDELGEVISAFSKMYGQITEAISERKAAENSLQESFRQVDAYSKALNKELEQGRNMQANFLPDRIPEKEGWEFAAFFKPARQVAGDFYDIFELPGGRVGIVIADVCDKGVGAALFMALFRSLIRIFSGQTTLKGLKLPDERTADTSDGGSGAVNPRHYHTSALEAIRMTNNYIVQNHDDLGMFATLFFGVLCPNTGLLTYINGGHEPVFVVGTKSGIEKLSRTGPAVGVTADATFAIEQVHLKPGDILFGYTDGVTEARSHDETLYGRDKLQALLESAGTTAGDLIEDVKSSLFAYIGDAPHEDDITLLAVQRSPDAVDSEDAVPC